jgi:hypothetical protein
VGQPILLSSSHLGSNTTFLLLSDSCGAPILTRVRVCRLQFRWPSPAQSYSGLSLAELMTICYCLRFETPPTWRAKSPRIYIPRRWVPFSSPPTTLRATVEVLEPAPAPEHSNLIRRSVGAKCTIFRPNTKASSLILRDLWFESYAGHGRNSAFLCVFVDKALRWNDPLAKDFCHLPVRFLFHYIHSE